MEYQWALPLVVFLTALQLCAAQTYSCSTSTGCSCEIGNSTDIDFSKLFKKQKVEVLDPTEAKYYYWLSLCEPISCTNGTEDVYSAACQFNSNKTDLEPTSLGRTDSVTWTITDETHFTVVYAGGDKAEPQDYDRVASFDITIDDTVKRSDMSFVSQDTDDKAKIYTYKFAMTLSEKDAYGGGGGKDLPIGYVGIALLLVLAIALALFFIIGAIVNSKVKGAGGTEVIPLVGFWKELPFLLKDGCAFTLSPCKALYNKRAGSYKSLN